MTHEELKTEHAKALRAIGMYRLTLEWVVQDIEAGVMDPKTIAAAKSDLASHLGGIDGSEDLVAKDRLDAARWRWLRDRKCNSLQLTRDGDHACNYMTAAEWIERGPEDYADVDPAEIQRMKDTNTIWALQIYPNTPVGFNVWHGATLDAAVDAAMNDD